MPLAIVLSLNDIFIYTPLRQINLSVIENRVITLASVANGIPGDNDFRNNGRNELEGVYMSHSMAYPIAHPKFCNFTTYVYRDQAL